MESIPTQQNVIIPTWPAPAQVKAYSTTRRGGFSLPPYDSLNLGDHVGDAGQCVTQNRQHLRTTLALPNEPTWLRQIHSDRVIALPAPQQSEADAAFTHQPNTVCVVMTADCLPVLFCNQTGDCVAAAHAGWRGLAAGILEATLHTAGFIPAETLAWLGPAIGAQAFAVGDEVRDIFVQRHAVASQAFRAQTQRPGYWWADIYQLARLRLQAVGVTQIYGGNYCTYQQKQHFFSYRRDKVTGRMASLLYLQS